MKNLREKKLSGPTYIVETMRGGEDMIHEVTGDSASRYMEGLRSTVRCECGFEGSPVELFAHEQTMELLIHTVTTDSIAAHARGERDDFECVCGLTFDAADIVIHVWLANGDRVHEIPTWGLK